MFLTVSIMLRKQLLLFLLLLTVSLTAWAHAYHASIMDVRYNAQKQQLEIALKVFTDDFEKALSTGRPTSSTWNSRQSRW